MFSQDAGNNNIVFFAESLKFLNFITYDACVHSCGLKKFMQFQPGYTKKDEAQVL